MAIVWVREALASGAGEGSFESGNSYTRNFDVLSDTYADNAITIASASAGGVSIPTPFSYFTKGNDTDYGSVVTRISPSRDDRYPLLWHVIVEYTVLRPASGEALPGGTYDVTLQLPEVRIWGIPVTEVIDKDITNKAITNSAGEAFNPLPEDVRYITAVEITSWVRSYNMDFWALYADTTNAEAIWGRAADTLLMQGMPSGTRKVDTVGTYYEVRLEIHWDKKGWKRKFLDAGRSKLVNSFGTEPSPSDPAAGVAPITNIPGIPIDQDVPLDGHGQPLAQGGNPVYLPFVIKESRSWLPLNLPALNITW